MLLAIDVGNTNVTLGLSSGETSLGSWRLQTVSARTTDEYALLVRRLLSDAGFELSEVSDVILASVVPALTPVMHVMSERLFSVQALEVGPGLKTGISVHYNPPTDVGADRIVNAVAARARVEGACIVVDFGTATTFDCVDAEGGYRGGTIAPGVHLAVSALVQAAARLPRVDVRRPERAIGRTTVESIQSGAFFGYVALVDGLVARLRAELDPTARVLATGGLAGPIAAESDSIEIVAEDLTLEGLRLIHAMNAKANR